MRKFIQLGVGMYPVSLSSTAPTNTPFYSVTRFVNNIATFILINNSLNIKKGSWLVVSRL